MTPFESIVQTLTEEIVLHGDINAYRHVAGDIVRGLVDNGYKIVVDPTFEVHPDGGTSNGVSTGD